MVQHCSASSAEAGGRSTVTLPGRLTVWLKLGSVLGCCVQRGWFGSALGPVDRGIRAPVDRKSISIRRCPDAITTTGQLWATRADRPWLSWAPQARRGRNPKSTLSKTAKSTIRPNFAEMLQSATFESENLRNMSKSSLTPRTRTSRHFANFTPQMLGFT